MDEETTEETVEETTEASEEMPDPQDGSFSIDTPEESTDEVPHDELPDEGTPDDESTSDEGEGVSDDPDEPADPEEPDVGQPAEGDHPEESAEEQPSDEGSPEEAPETDEVSDREVGVDPEELAQRRAQSRRIMDPQRTMVDAAAIGAENRRADLRAARIQRDKHRKAVKLQGRDARGRFTSG